MAVNGLYIVQGEANAVVALLKKAHRNWPHHQQQIYLGHSLLDETDPLLRNFADLRDVFNSVNDLLDMNPDTYLSPFLDVIRSDQTNGPVTAQALSSVAKFLSYGLIDSSSIKASNAVENIADAVTHAKFIGSADSGRDEVVLLKILQVLRTLLLTPVGRLLSNESVCEMMQSCFRISFEPALSELLRGVAEATLSDMTQLLFTRLSTFQEDIRHPYIRKLVKRAGHLVGKRKRRKTYFNDIVKNEKGEKDDTENDIPKPRQSKKEDVELIKEENSQESGHDVGSPQNAGLSSSIEMVPHLHDKVERKHKSDNSQATVIDEAETTSVAAHQHLMEKSESVECYGVAVVSGLSKESFEAVKLDSDDGAVPDSDDSSASPEEDNNEKGRVARKRIKSPEEMVKPISDFEKGNSVVNDEKPVPSTEIVASSPTTHIPYGIPCVRELLRFLIALTNPLDRANTESMILMALNLLTVALEAGADHIRSFSLLMPLVKDELCRALLQLLDTEKLPIFAATNRVCFLLFESLRSDLKFQLEMYFLKLQSIITSEQTRISYEQKEMALESIVQLWRIAGLVTEIYLNYDCDLYCSNLFEDLTKLLLENAFPVLGLRSVNLLSLDGLLTVIDTIDNNCVYRQAGGVHHKTIVPTSVPAQLHLPVISGYAFGRQSAIDGTLSIATAEKTALFETFLPSTALRANRMAPSSSLPSIIEVIERKKKKRIITEATELFNQDPKKGIEFLKEKKFFKSPLDPVDVVTWLKANPRLDKKRIADYICNRKNAAVLDAFVRSFPFENTRLDDALRMFLETFRLPGEAAEISMVMQHFADHWYITNGEPFNHVDAAFTLAYAVIMLNTDQHNPQVRRNQRPMQAECFKRNLSGTNGGQDFDPAMLDEMYNAIRNEEIVMPAEQVGIVKENYLWKVLLRRGETKEGEFIHVPAGWNDHDLFSIIWGPASASLSFVFDKSGRDTILQKVLNGYRKCASIAAHYGMSDVFDNLIIHLCKFSTLMATNEDNPEQNLDIQQQGVLIENSNQSAEQIAIAFGENAKAQMAARAMFQLVHAHGDILREGWKNVLDSILRLFYARLLPAAITEVEDFVDSKGWVSIQRAPPPKLSANRNDSSLLSWLGLGSNYDSRESVPTADQQQFIKIAQEVIAECHPEQLIVDGKYLTSSALSELIGTIIQASTNVAHTEMDKGEPVARKLKEQEEDALVLYLELMVSIALENKDRLSLIWTPIKQHLQWFMSDFGRNPLIVERAVVGLLRIANRNLYHLKDDIADEVLQSLGILLKLPPPAMFMFSRQIAYGLHELLRTNAANVHRREHWAILFGIMEAVGAGVYPEDFNTQLNDPGLSQKKSKIVNRQVHSDTEPSLNRSRVDNTSETIYVDRGYTSDVVPGSVSSISSLSEHIDSAASLLNEASTEWIHVDHRDVALAAQQQQFQLKPTGKQHLYSSVFDRGTVVLRTNLIRHDPLAFLKVGETLTFLARDAAHITPENFDSCIECLRSCTEASLDGGRYAAGPLSGDAQSQLRSVLKDSKSKNSVKQERGNHRHMLLKTESNHEEEGMSSQAEPQKLSASYQQVAFQMLDLCHTLHVKGAAIYRSWAYGGAEIDASLPALWNHCWRPLLQCIARLCCDCRRQVRTQALNFLVRAFLIPEMQAMEGRQWEECFGEVLFPLLQKLLENLSPMDPIGMEETRVRVMQLISKILLNHLTPLSLLASFRSLWLRLLDYMDQYLHADRSDLLSEAIPESLKNMILVMDNTEMFCTIPDLYDMTVTRIGAFLPELLAEVMPGPPRRPHLPDVKLQETPESLLQGENPEITKPGSREAVSILPQQFNIDRQVLIAPPIDLTTQLQSPNPGHLQPEDIAYNGGTSKCADLSEVAVEIPIPELEEVIVHSGSTSPPSQSYFVTAEANAQPSILFSNGESDVCGRDGITCDEQLSNQQFSYAQTAQIYNTDYSCDAERLKDVNDETQFATASVEGFRIVPPRLLYAQQQLEQLPFIGSQSSQISWQAPSVSTPMMIVDGPLVPSPNSAFSPPVSSSLRSVVEASSRFSEV
ncbi:Sec7 domain-containing protein [Loa loa]|uniref:Sec7 domain-containing protein n=1 Tax=Loa loa TaxID=7209 RepID=A0A1S0TXW2_LOALO|nr:Sec7 domain-containing protein [Loa loa]EFO21246.1 Sec7 domain-containing protein [Loa loa]